MEFSKIGVRKDCECPANTPFVFHDETKFDGPRSDGKTSRFTCGECNAEYAIAEIDVLFTRDD